MDMRYLRQEDVKHFLKTNGTCWDAIERGEKKFEVRFNDRFFQRGDVVVLRRLEEDGTYSADEPFTYREIKFRIGWVLQGGAFGGIQPGYIVFQLDEYDDATKDAPR